MHFKKTVYSLAYTPPVIGVYYILGILGLYPSYKSFSITPSLNTFILPRKWTASLPLKNGWLEDYLTFDMGPAFSLNSALFLQARYHLGRDDSHDCWSYSPKGFMRTHGVPPGILGILKESLPNSALCQGHGHRVSEYNPQNPRQQFNRSSNCLVRAANVCNYFQMIEVDSQVASGFWVNFSSIRIWWAMASGCSCFDAGATYAHRGCPTEVCCSSNLGTYVCFHWSFRVLPPRSHGVPHWQSGVPKMWWRWKARRRKNWRPNWLVGSGLNKIPTSLTTIPLSSVLLHSSPWSGGCRSPCYSWGFCFFSCSSKFVLDCFGSLLLGLTCMLLFHQGLTSL